MQDSLTDRRLVSISLGLVLVAAVTFLALRGGARPSCDERPPFEQVGSALATCLGPDASPADVEAILRGWGYLGPDWGQVMAAELTLDGGPELLLHAYPDLENASWNPRGRFIVLQRDGRQWRIGFDASSIQATTSLGEPWDNWRYKVLSTADATGDGVGDLLLELVHSNGLRTTVSNVALITSHGGGMEFEVAYLDETIRTRPRFRLLEKDGRPALQAVIQVGSQDAITRTFAYDGAALSLTDEAINPAAATTTATLPDGSSWYGFDQFDGGGGTPPYAPMLGLYRQQRDQLGHFDIPGAIRVLTAGPDGALYVGTGCGVLRYQGDGWETLLDPACGGSPFTGPFVPVDLEFGSSGDLWAGGVFTLLHYDGAQWTQYDIRARRILVAPDDTVWAEGWDGRAGSGCCYTHLTGDSWVTYTHSATLPVPAGLQDQIHDLLR
jgi:hypothetical protein